MGHHLFSMAAAPMFWCRCYSEARYIKSFCPASQHSIGCNFIIDNTYPVFIYRFFTFSHNLSGRRFVESMRMEKSLSPSLVGKLFKKSDKWLLERLRETNESKLMIHDRFLQCLRLQSSLFQTGGTIKTIFVLNSRRTSTIRSLEAPSPVRILCYDMRCICHIII